MDFCIFDLEKCDKSLFLLLSFAYNSFAAVHLLKSFTGYYLAHFLHLQYSHYLSQKMAQNIETLLEKICLSIQCVSIW